jgi:hypothetical protein
MNDMSAVIVPKSDQINAEDFVAGPATFEIEGVSINPGTEQPVSIKLVGERRVWRPCKSMSRVLVTGWGADANAYVGRSVTLYCDPKVKWGGLEVGGIRISHMSHIERDMIMALTATKGKRAPHQVKVLQVQREQAPAQQKQSGMTAEQWATDHIAFVAGAADLERLASVQNAGKKSMDKLAGTNPGLHAKVKAAYAKRLDELSGGPVFEPEGRDDPDFGDQFPGTEDAE